MPSHISVFSRSGEHLGDLKPIPMRERAITEDTLQRIIYSQPELISSPEIDADYGKLIPLAREVPIQSGSIDILLMTPEGRLCVVETKLWRNAEAHRTVVAQVLDYAKDLASLSFNELIEKVTRRSGEEARRDFFKVARRRGELDEIELQENMVHSLAHGRFLLLVVGDTIRPNLLLLSETIQSAPHLEFKLALLELHLYELDEERLLVVPSLVGKTVEQTRAVVKIQYEEKKPTVEVTSIEPSEQQAGKTSYKEFVGSMPEGFADFFIPAYEDWIAKGYIIYWGTVGLTVRLDVKGKPKTVFEIHPTATSIFSKKWEKSKGLPPDVCQQYRDGVKDSVNLTQLLSNNRSYVRLQEITLEDFALHMQEANKVVHRLAEYYRSGS